MRHAGSLALLANADVSQRTNWEGNRSDGQRPSRDDSRNPPARSAPLPARADARSAPGGGSRERKQENPDESLRCPLPPGRRPRAAARLRGTVLPRMGTGVPARLSPVLAESDWRIFVSSAEDLILRKLASYGSGSGVVDRQGSSSCWSARSGTRHSRGL